MGDRVEQALYLGSDMCEGTAPEAVSWILDQLYESDQEAPGVWPIDYQPLQQYTCDLLLHHLLHSHLSSHICASAPICQQQTADEKMLADLAQCHIQTEGWHSTLHRMHPGTW